MKVKTLVSGLLVATLISTTSVAYASPKDKSTETTSFTESKEIYTADGELIGSLVKTTTIEQEKTGKEINYVYTEVSDYELEPSFQAIPEYAAEFADNTEVNTYSVNSKNEFLANGKKVIVEEEESGFTTLSDTGGVPAFSHYYSTADLTNYYFATYSDIKWTVTQYARADGSHVAKYIKRTNSFFADAKSSVDSFANDYNDYQWAMTDFLVESALAAATLETVIGAIAFGGLAGYSALKAYNAWQDAEESIGKAYTYVNAA